MQNNAKLEEEEISDKKKIQIGMFNLIAIAVFTIVGLIVKNIFFVAR